MGSKSFFSTINDCDTNTTFAVVVICDGMMTAHGSVKQGKDWAGWVNAGAKSLDQIRLSLDPSLRMAEFVPLSRENLMARYSLFGPTTAKHLIALIEDDAPNAPVSVGFPDTESKSAETGDTEALPPEPVEEQEPEAEPIRTWLMSDVGISMFDVQMKMDAVQFKARQFARNKNFASFVTCVKGSRATVFDGRWRAMPAPNRDLSRVLDGFDRRIKTNAFAFLDRIGYFEKSAPIGLVNLPPPHIARDADSDSLIYEGIAYINRGRGIPDPTPFGISEMIRGVRSFNGQMANIMEKPSRVLRATRRDAEAQRINALSGATNDLNRLIPDAASGASGASRLRRRLSDLAENIKPATQTPLAGDKPRTRRENRRILEGQSRLAQAGNPIVGSPANEPMGAMRNERGESPSTSPVVRAAEQRAPTEVTRGSGGGRRSDRGKNPRKDGERMLDRLSARLSRISKGLGRSGAAETEDMNDVPVPPAPADAPDGAVGDPWLMDDASKRNLLSAIDALRATLPNGARRPFNSRFAEDEIEWSDFTPAEQSSLVGQLRSRRDQLVANINEIMTPVLPNDPDYRVDGVVTPRSVANAVADGHFFLTEGGANLYPDVTALLAIDDILSSTDPVKQSSAWRMIDDRNRSVVSRAAEIQRRDMRDAGRRRAQGAIGERTVINPSREPQPIQSRLLPLSKIQPRRLVFAPEKPADLKKITEYTTLEQQAIIESADRLRQGIADYLRSNLNITGDTPMTEDVLADRIAKLTPENAEKFQLYAHNLIVLDDLVSSAARGIYGPTGKVEYFLAEPMWSALTIPARNKILSEANVGLVPQVAKTSKPKPRKPRTVVAPTAPAAPSQQASSEPPKRGSAPIGMSTGKKKREEFVVTDSRPVSVVVDATNRLVTTTLEDGTQETKALSSFGRPRQFDFTNAHLVDDVLYVWENNLQLYRDPVTGNFLTDYRNIPITIDNQISRADDLEPVQSAKNAPIVSYPNVTPPKADSKKIFGLSDQTSDRPTITELLSQVFGIDQQQAEALLSTKIFLAPNVMPGKSVDNFRQAALLLMNQSSIGDDIPQVEKNNLQMLDIVDIPEGSDPIESYLNHIGRPDIAVAYVSAGRPADFLDFPDHNSAMPNTISRDGLNIPASSVLPSHLKFLASKNKLGAYRYGYGSRLGSIFSPTDAERQHQTLVPEMRADSKPRTRKMIVLWRHPDNFDDKYRYNRQTTNVEDIANKVNKALETDSQQDWFVAFEAVRDAYREASRKRTDALDTWRNSAGKKSRSPRPRREFVMAGEMLESLEKILTDIFAPNMDKVVDSVRTKKEQHARTSNEMQRLRARTAETGVKNVAGLEEELLVPPVDAEGNPMPPRKPKEILETLVKHAASGFLPNVPPDLAPGDPIERTELTDEAISTLALIMMSAKSLVDPETQRPVAEIYPMLGRGDNRGTPEVSERNALHNALYWALGFKGRPVMLTESEYELLLGSSLTDETTNVNDDDWVRNAVDLRRGIENPKQGKTAHQMADEFLSGEFYLIGEGGNAGGHGVNFSRGSITQFSGYGGNDPNGDIILAVVPITARFESKERMHSLQHQLQEMYGAFFSAITHFGGTEKTMPVDLDATDDPDWSHEDVRNPYFRSGRENTGYGYFVPHGRETVGAHQHNYSGESIQRIARERGIVIPEVDTADPSAIQDLATVIMTLMDGESPIPTRGTGRLSSADPLAGDQWWRATRMQVFGWMVQLEILKSMEIAKMKAQGKVPWNEELAKLMAAQELLSYWSDEVLMGALFGIDAYTTTSLPVTKNQVTTFKGNQIGDHIMVLNRTAIAVLAKPATKAMEKEILERIRNPKIRKPGDPSKVWNPFTRRWIDDPDYEKGAQDQYE